MAEIILAVLLLGVVVWLVLYMTSQKQATAVQRLIHEHRYQEAVEEADRMLAHSPKDTATRLHRAEAAKLQGDLESSLRSYREVLHADPDDAAAREGVALNLAHLGRDLEEARRLMDETMQSYPQIQEFQALSLAYILSRQGSKSEALRIFDDNLVLLQTRFELDYTDPDPLLAETVYLFALLSEESGEDGRASALYNQVKSWAPGSLFARWAADRINGLTASA